MTRIIMWSRLRKKKYKNGTPNGWKTHRFTLLNSFILFQCNMFVHVSRTRKYQKIEFRFSECYYCAICNSMYNYLCSNIENNNKHSFVAPNKVLHILRVNEKELCTRFWNFSPIVLFLCSSLLYFIDLYEICVCVCVLEKNKKKIFPEKVTHYF